MSRPGIRVADRTGGPSLLCPAVGSRGCRAAYYESMAACLQEVRFPYLTALGVEQEPDNQGLTAFHCPSDATIYASRKNTRKRHPGRILFRRPRGRDPVPSAP